MPLITRVVDAGREPRRAPQLRVAGAAVVAQLVFVACADCDPFGITPQYLVRLRDASTGEPICDAKVFVNDLEYPPHVDCFYAAEIPTAVATATIRAEHPGYQNAEKQVSTQYASDSCGHALRKNVELALEKL